jgi:hypothetical protein
MDRGSVSKMKLKRRNMFEEAFSFIFLLRVSERDGDSRMGGLNNGGIYSKHQSQACIIKVWMLKTT